MRLIEVQESLREARDELFKVEAICVNTVPDGPIAGHRGCGWQARVANGPGEGRHSLSSAPATDGSGG